MVFLKEILDFDENLKLNFLKFINQHKNNELDIVWNVIHI